MPLLCEREREREREERDYYSCHYSFSLSSPSLPLSLLLLGFHCCTSGLPRSYPKTTIGDDGNPNPIGSTGVPQPPMTIAALPRAHAIRASDSPQQGGGVQMLHHHSVKVSTT